MLGRERPIFSSKSRRRLWTKLEYHSSDMSTRPEDLRQRFTVDTKDIDDDNMPARTQGRQSKTVVKIFVSAVTGMLFGIALEQGRVFIPQVIREQMLFSKFIMLKMFLSASASGMLSFSLLHMIPATSMSMEIAQEEFIAALLGKSVTGAAVGGFILGCGMTLAGACPGLVLAQVGAAVPYSILTMVGGLCGSYLYALTEPILNRFFQRKREYQDYTLDEYLGTPSFNLALPFAAILGMVIFGVEMFAPWTSEVELSGSSFLEFRAWPPFLAGTLIGLLQIPTVLTVQDTLGSATSYVTVASQLLYIKPFRSLFPYLKKYMTGMIHWWQVIYVSGAIGGAHIASKWSGTYGTIRGVGPLPSFFGGILMLYGSRLAGGCTSGHGLSGMGMLVLLSFVAVPAMFTGGISLAVLMKYGLGMDM